MKHLFIINPVSFNVKNREQELSDMIKDFFKHYIQFEYEIHITRWSRDAVGFVRRYTEQASQLVRVYAVGGTGTLYEIINAVAGLPNVQVACFPQGYYNSFTKSFGKNKMHLFKSLRSLIFSDTMMIDLIRCNHNYGITFCSVGLESLITYNLEKIYKKIGLHIPLFYNLVSIYTLLSTSYTPIKYNIMLDDLELNGIYASILVANSPCYDRVINCADEASPNDGFLDVYLLRHVSFWQYFYWLKLYSIGTNKKLPPIISHYKAKRVKISSESVICINIDYEISYDKSAEFEIVPYAIDFVAPKGLEKAQIHMISDNGYIGGDLDAIQ